MCRARGREETRGNGKHDTGEVNWADNPLFHDNFGKKGVVPLFTSALVQNRSTGSGALLELESDSQVSNHIRWAQSKRPFQSIQGHFCIDFNSIWTRPIFSQGRSKDLDLTRRVCWQPCLADPPSSAPSPPNTKHSFPEDHTPQMLHDW